MTNLTFGKGESQTAKHFLSFDSLMSTTLFIHLLYSLLLIQKQLKLPQLASWFIKRNLNFLHRREAHFYRSLQSQRNYFYIRIVLTYGKE